MGHVTLVLANITDSVKTGQKDKKTYHFITYLWQAAIRRHVEVDLWAAAM